MAAILKPVCDRDMSSTYDEGISQPATINQLSFWVTALTYF